MHVLMTDFNGNPNVGLYAAANNDLVLIARDVPVEVVTEIEKVLDVKAHRISIAGTGLIGVFCIMINDKIMVPDIIFDDELEILKDLGLKVKVIKTKLTALGNNILCNSNGCMINPEYPDDVMEEISKFFGIDVMKGTIADLNTLGSMAKVNNNGGLLHFDATDKELEAVSKLLQIEVETSSINTGNPYISSGIIANDKGFVIGAQSSGIEQVDADRALGFINK
ncbi:translation initiation factor IF-6 [Candidatus Woesearchaeota archaeon]|nr:translation initiation factor IF-6 [Candidatus Woesearchaeota archaeon]